MKKTIRVLGLSFFSALVLTACGGGSETPQKPNVPEQPAEPEVPTGIIQGTVSSTVTNVEACQLYLYAQNVTTFAKLLQQIHDEVPGLLRLRFVTSYYINKVGIK